MKKAIVTGANGQLGNEIKRIAAQLPEIKFIYTDIDSLDLSNKTDVEAYILDNNPDFVINCAAFTAVDKAETETELAEKINAKVPEYLAQLSNTHNFNFIHISTDYVFSGKQHLPTTEQTPTEPESEYGKTKLLGERLVLQTTDAIVIRTSWLYSVFGNNFVKSMLRFGAEREQIGVVYDQVGTPTNAADLAQGIIRILEKNILDNIWHGGIYHFSNEGVCSWFDFAKEIMQLANLSCNVKPILTHEYPLPAPRPAFSVMNKQKIKETFNFAIPYWKDSLVKAVNEITSNK